MNEHYHHECEEYCEDCAPKDAKPGNGEQDCPINCCNCGRPLDYSLTSDGVEYVISYIIEALENGLDNHIIPLTGTLEVESLTYYHGSPHYEIVRDWAKDLEAYSLDRKDAVIVQMYLEACDRADKSLTTT